MEIKIERKINTTEIKERLSNVTNSMKDRTYVSISKDEIKDIISILEYLEKCEKEQEEENKKCYREFDSINFACCICENRDTCKEEKPECFGKYKTYGLAYVFCKDMKTCEKDIEIKGRRKKR